MRITKKRKHIAILVVAAILMCSPDLVFGRMNIVSAKSEDISWSQPVRLSDPNIQSWPPTIGADKAGNVHILWAQSMVTTSEIGQGDTLFYTRWDGKEWLPPSDVLVSPNGLGAEFPDIAFTPDGWLHAVWGTGGQSSQLMYSRAPACCANNPHNWSTPVVLGSYVNETSAIFADSQGRLHLVYASLQSKNILYQHSEDSGKNWSTAVEIFGAIRQNDEYPAYPRIAVDGRGRIHLVWSVLPFPGRAIVYARSDDGGTTWTHPYLVDTANKEKYQTNYGPILIDVEAVGKDEIHITWDGAPTVERHHIWSSDGGSTWSDPDTFIPELSGGGRALWNDMAVDSENILHAVSIKQPWHAMWTGNWSRSTAIGTQGFAEDMRIAVSQGNVLNVAWLQVVSGKPSVIYYVRGVTTAPSVPCTPLPAVLTETPHIAVNILTPEPKAGTANPTSVEKLDFQSKNELNDDPGSGVLISGIVVFIFLCGVFVYIYVHKK